MPKSIEMEPKCPDCHPRVLRASSFPFDRTIMSPFINWWPFYLQTSLEKLPRTAPPSNRNSYALRQPHPYQRLLHMR
jgi:hypothetical protein